MDVDVDVFGEMGKEEGVWLCHVINRVGLDRIHEALELHFE